ncbi:MAG: MspA family porin [Mycobacteriaceae bacterium]|nr:MspA family porin [Mycobacteriaceae bacterium]
MRSKSVLLCICTALCAMPSARADVVALPPHEKTFRSAFGSFTVGNRDETISRILPLNQAGFTRESLVGATAYARINGAASGVLKTGYHVGCAADFHTGTAGVTSALPLGVGPNPGLSLDPGPVATVNIGPGEVKEVAVAEKQIQANAEGTIIVRDFHIIVNECVGPVAVRQFTYLYVKSPSVDDNGAVFGNPQVL